MAHLPGKYPNNEAYSDTIISMSKKTQSTNHRKGGRKKTLSLNPEEREALENLIEEVILDGGMGDSESGSSDEEGKNPDAKKTNVHHSKTSNEITLSDPKGLASAKMPKKYYPGQLKVALKHMTDLPPRFSRKLKKAERYLELNAASLNNSKKVLHQTSIKEEDEDEIASINADKCNIDPQQFSPSKLTRAFANNKQKNSKDNQMKDLKRSIRILLTDLDQYVDENDRTSLSLDLPVASSTAEVDNELQQTHTPPIGAYRKSESQSSDDSKHSGSMLSLKHGTQNKKSFSDSYAYNHSPISHLGHPRKPFDPNSSSYYHTSKGNFSHNPAHTSKNFSKPHSQMNVMPSDASGVYFMPLPQPSSYYQAMPPQNYSMPPPPLFQYPPQRFPMTGQYFPYSSSEFPCQPPTNTYGSQLNMQMPGNYKVTYDASKLSPNYSQQFYYPSTNFQNPYINYNSSANFSNLNELVKEPSSSLHNDTANTSLNCSKDVATDSHDVKEQKVFSNDDKTTKNNDNVHSSTINTGDVVTKDKVEAVEVHESWGDIMEKIDNENKDKQDSTSLVSNSSEKDVKDKNNNSSEAANNNLCEHEENLDELADIRLSDDVNNEDNINVILDKKFIMKLVERFSNGSNPSVDKDKLLDRQVVLDEKVLRSIYDAIA